MALFQLLKFYGSYHEKRVAEGLSQDQLFWRELKLIAAALLTIVLMGGFLAALAWYFTQ